MTLTFDLAREITDRRNAAMMASDLDAFLALGDRKNKLRFPHRRD